MFCLGLLKVTSQSAASAGDFAALSVGDIPVMEQISHGPLNSIGCLLTVMHSLHSKPSPKQLVALPARHLV